MILISSSAYVVSEFQVELGEIPPCFLPLGNKKLIEHQVEQLKLVYPNDDIVVSLPESFEISYSDEVIIKSLGVEIIKVPDDFSLAESISFVLNVFIASDSNSFKVIYGDTLILDFPDDSNDLLGVAISNDGYKWFVESRDDDIQVVWCGFFIFNSKLDLLRCLALHRSDFIEAVQRYRKIHSMSIRMINKWYDLGHVNTYFRSRAEITTQRSFNELNFVNGVLFKTGDNLKISAESNWFRSVPVNLRRFLPQLIDFNDSDSNNVFYALEYLPNLPLNELFVHGKNHVHEWNIIFNKIKDFMLESTSEKLNLGSIDLILKDYNHLIKTKTYHRLNSFTEVNDLDFDMPNYYSGIKLPSINEICITCVEKAMKLRVVPSILHGDLCLSNILYDSRTQSIKVIDPRGITSDGCLSITGNQIYDLAKLTHSFIGLYDHIIAGRYSLIDFDTHNVELLFDIDERILNIQKSFAKFKFVVDYSIDEIMPVVILLFLSMLPLHNDRPDRQKAMFVNALRLYTKYLHS